MTMIGERKRDNDWGEKKRGGNFKKPKRNRHIYKGLLLGIKFQKSRYGSPEQGKLCTFKSKPSFLCVLNFMGVNKGSANVGICSISPTDCIVN